MLGLGGSFVDKFNRFGIDDFNVVKYAAAVDTNAAGDEAGNDVIDGVINAVLSLVIGFIGVVDTSFVDNEECSFRGSVVDDSLCVDVSGSLDVLEVLALVAPWFGVDAKEGGLDIDDVVNVSSDTDDSSTVNIFSGDDVDAVNSNGMYRVSSEMDVSFVGEYTAC